MKERSPKMICTIMGVPYGQQLLCTYTREGVAIWKACFTFISDICLFSFLLLESVEGGSITGPHKHPLTENFPFFPLALGFTFSFVFSSFASRWFEIEEKLAIS